LSRNVVVILFLVNQTFAVQIRRDRRVVMLRTESARCCRRKPYKNNGFPLSSSCRQLWMYGTVLD
jgi:hypothetical protein